MGAKENKKTIRKFKRSWKDEENEVRVHGKKSCEKNRMMISIFKEGGGEAVGLDKVTWAGGWMGLKLF